MKNPKTDKDTERLHSGLVRFDYTGCFDVGCPISCCKGVD